jgi:hypothetical protein
MNQWRNTQFSMDAAARRKTSTDPLLGIEASARHGWQRTLKLVAGPYRTAPVCDCRRFYLRIDF